MVKIRDVAKFAGVSPSTVSRTLSGSAKVEPETQRAVLQAIKQLNYKPNLAARSLKNGSSKLIGLIIPDIMNPYYPEIVKQFEVSASNAGYSLILCDALGSIQKEIEYFETLTHLCVDGILYVSSTESIEHVAPFIGTIPMVIINRTFDVNALCVNIDNVDAGYTAVKYLAERGHRRIAIYINNKLRQYNQERLEGAKKALAEYGIAESEVCLVSGVESEEDAYQKTLQLIRQPDLPTAIFVLNDNMAFGVYHGLLERGLRIPEDVSVIGFDDIPQVKYLNPPLTTIRHSVLDTAEDIFKKLLEQIQQGDCAGNECIYCKGTLIERDSVRERPKEP